MPGLPILLLLASSTVAHAQAIFPSGGEVPPIPTIWISAAEIPAISIRDDKGPVLFEVDEMNVEGGMHRISVRPQLDIGSKFTVQAGKVKASFTVVDGDRHGIEAQTPEIEVDFKRIAVEHRAGGDFVIVDAVAKHGTVMYLLNQEHNTLEYTPPYTWVGEGRAIGTLRRFEISLAAFGASCASTKSIEFSPYTVQLAGGATLYPVAKIQIAKGKIRLPLEIIDPGGEQIEDRAWLPCPGASVDAKPAVETPTPPLEQTPIDTAIEEGTCHHDDSQYARCTDAHAVDGAQINAMDSAAMPREGSEPASTTWIPIVALFALLSAIALVMWRATHRAAA